MEENKDKWLNYLATATVLFALGATLSTLRVGSYSNRSILRQTQASNQWAYYQAKSIKSYLYELQKEKLEIDLKQMRATAPSDLLQEYEKKIQSYDKKLKTYEEEKAEIQREARSLEGQRDVAVLHSQAFGLAVILLQLSILLSSIAALMKKKPVWYLGLVLGAVGAVYFANGFWLFM
ncbi:MAG: DUF4337 domain-containing protein [Desulfomonile tiedjei]|nr:DUF4337 domain-containing protein [Desulfomonile tiedjei]